MGVLIFLCSGVFALSGVSPGSYEINYDGVFSGDFVFEFVFDKGVEAELYVDGDLAEYVSLDKEKLIGGGKVTASLSLPEEVDSPGVNRIRIGARQISSGEGGIGIVSDVRGIIKVNIPYPGKYVELDLNAPNANVGEFVNLSLTIFNRGEENVSVDSMIQIFKDGEFLETIEFEDKKVISLDSVTLDYALDTSEYSPGDYTATALVNYSGAELARDDNPFKLGEFLIKIVNYTQEVNEDKLSRFLVEVESFYNDPIGGLYASLEISGNEEAGFISPTIKLNPWSKGTLEGFVDVSELGGETFEAELTIYYGNESVSEKVSVVILKGKDSILFWVLLSSLVILGLLIWRVWVFVKRTRKKKKK